jgi:hypothetical protein
MSTTAPVNDLWVRPQEKERHGKHKTVNRWLASIALVLGIILMLGAIYVGAEALYKLYQLQSALNEIGQETGQAFDPAIGEESPYDPTVPYDPRHPEECYNPGGGEVCAPGGADGLPEGD